MIKKLLMIFMLIPALSYADDVDLWYVDRVIIGDWQKAFNSQYGKTLTLYLKSENPGLNSQSFDSKDGLINAHGSLSYSKQQNIVTRITEICVVGRCIDHTVNIDHIEEASDFKLTLSDATTGDISKVTILSFDPLTLHFDNLPGMKTWGIIQYRKKLWQP